MSFMAIAFGSGFLTLTFCFIVCFVKTIPRKPVDSVESEDNDNGRMKSEDRNNKPAEAGSKQNEP